MGRIEAHSQCHWRRHGYCHGWHSGYWVAHVLRVRGLRLGQLPRVRVPEGGEAVHCGVGVG